jgi:hypothetical protein
MEYRFPLTNQGATSVWSLVSGNFPDGVSLDSTADKIIGTPTAAGDFVLSIQVSDSLGEIDKRDFVLTVT